MKESKEFKMIEPNSDYIVMEFCQNGDLFNLVKSKGPLSSRLAKFLFLQIAEAVEFLHRQGGICHLDLKLENVLLSNDLSSIKLCDFGFVEPIGAKIK